MADVGSALTGRFEDRRNEPWPTAQLPGGPAALPQTLTNEALVQALHNKMVGPEIPPITSRLQQQAGAGDVEPISKEELLRFIIQNEMTNPGPQGR